MGKGDFLGEFEQLVLIALIRVGEGAYGMTVRREIEERAGRDVSIGAVYATLENRSAVTACVRPVASAAEDDAGAVGRVCAALPSARAY